MKIIPYVILALMTTVACKNEKTLNFAEQIEEAHHKTDFQREKAIEFEILLVFGDKTRLSCKMTLLTNTTKGVIEEKGGERLFFDHEHIYLDTTVTPIEGARFKAYTWSYFFFMPYKLTDPGSVWNTYPDSTLNGKTYNTGELTFEGGTGDADQDWYIIYADKETSLLHAAAYIVTANKTREEAEKDPHAIVYENYKAVDGIPIAQKWTFYEWRKTEGLTKELGRADLAGMKFVEVDSSYYTPPAHFIEN